MNENRFSVRKMTITALLMAMNIIMSTSVLSIPVPGGHMYLNDVIIVTAAVLLDPFSAFLVGGVGAFIGDMLFYPAPMFVSLVVQSFSHTTRKEAPSLVPFSAGLSHLRDIPSAALIFTAPRLTRLQSSPSR